MELKEAGREVKLGKRPPAFPYSTSPFICREERFLVDDYGRVHVRWEFLSHTRMAGEEGYPAAVIAL